MCCVKLHEKRVNTAFAYGNEKAVGEGIRASGVNRDEIFVTTKHRVTMRGHEKAAEAIDISLKNLGLDYLDLYLVHWPCVEKVSPDWKEINASTCYFELSEEDMALISAMPELGFTGWLPENAPADALV